MAIKAKREIARADMNDNYGVSVWQEKKLVDYTIEEARTFAMEILHASDEAERVAREDHMSALAKQYVGWMLGSDLATGANAPVEKDSAANHQIIGASEGAE